MNKVIIVPIALRSDLRMIKYQSEDASLPISDRESLFPIIPVLEKSLQAQDNVKVVLLLKDSGIDSSKENAQAFRNELEQVNAAIGATIEYEEIITPYSEKTAVQEGLMNSIVQAIPESTHILADITYGPRDIPTVIYAALEFATKYLDCTVDNIVYGLGFFTSSGKLEKVLISDMSPLFSLTSLTSMIKTTDPGRAKEMLGKMVKLSEK